MKVSYSKLDTYYSCPYKYKLMYIDRLKAKIPETPNNALFLGTAVHEGLEHKSVEKAIESYKSNYSILDEANEVEIFKLEQILPRVINKVPSGKSEVKLSVKDEFVGYVDLLVKVDEDTYDLYDYKHSNNKKSYLESGQLHIYKYYFERINPDKKIRNMYYVMIPKYKDILTEDMSDEDKENLRDKIIKYYFNNDVEFIKVEYDRTKVNQFFARKAMLMKETEFNKFKSWKCKWCDFKKYCETDGQDRSELIEDKKGCEEDNVNECFIEPTKGE